MDYSIIFPCTALKGCLSHFWASRPGANVHGETLYYSTANTNTELAFAFSSNSTQPQLVFAALQGHTGQHAQIPVDSGLEMFGVSIYSHAVPLLFDVHTAFVSGQMIDIETLPGGMEIISQMMSAAGTQQRVKVLSDYFTARLLKNSIADKMAFQAVSEIRKHKGLVGISGLASELCLSQKQFERRFRNFTGFNPKMYARIIRFENAMANNKKFPSLGALAHSYGYYDQAHFISDFKAFSGFSPTTFFALSGY